ncbi:hypothetical protein TrCOL_g10193 [Triparma columacea]|uniref:Uncharacterized protein n=1 Tax=Triparma columacea TaxID=722753 RepID=A0A9W7GB64_9STRA|nr:hypothetical protein TrCOL_g10193 [Triparma columacea]
MSAPPSAPLSPSCRFCEEIHAREMKERQALTRQLVATEKKLIQLGGTNPSPSPFLPKKSPSESLEDMSLRMQEMNARHRSTVAEMERGSSRVRHELTIKVSKLSDLVLTMNEENAKTRGELKRAQDRIEVVTAERNYFVKETQVLEAELRELTKTKPDPTLVARLEAETARASELDGAVLKLSSRLQSAMSIIRELENTPHNPPQKAVNFIGAQPPRPPPSASSSHSQMLVKTLSAQLTQQRIACKSAMLQVEEVRKLGLAREERLLKRIKELEMGLR